MLGLHGTSTVVQARQLIASASHLFNDDIHLCLARSMEKPMCQHNCMLAFALPTGSAATSLFLGVAGKAAKFLGKLGQKLARNVYNEAGEALQGHTRTAAELRATLRPCHTCTAYPVRCHGQFEPHSSTSLLL